jgi:hypothetical protein
MVRDPKGAGGDVAMESIGTWAAVVLIGIVIRGVWLSLLSYIVSKLLFRDELPLARALKTVGMAYAINWALWFVMVMASPPAIAGLIRLDWQGIAIGFAAAIVVFLWEWRSFSRHWSPDDDVAEVFE